MKTLITTFAIAVMVFAFNPISVMALEETPCDPGEIGLGGDSCKPAPDIFSENESGETDSEREVADSGDEGSTSAASTDDQ